MIAKGMKTLAVLAVAAGLYLLHPGVALIVAGLAALALADSVRERERAR